MARSVASLDSSRDDDNGLSVCTYYNFQTGCSRERCRYLHFCQFWIAGQCKFETSCKRSHEVSSGEKIKIVKYGHDPHSRNFWEYLKEKTADRIEGTQGAKAERSRDNISPVKLPNLCTFYNTQRGCDKENQCPFVHLCKHWTASRCANRNCRYNHALIPKDVNLLLGCGLVGDATDLTVKFIQSKRSGEQRGARRDSSSDCRSTVSTSSATSVSNARKLSAVRSLANQQVSSGEEICNFYLREACKFGSSCSKVHPICKTKFAWHYKDLMALNVTNWIQFDADCSLTLERAFCDVKQDSAMVLIPSRRGGSVKIDLNTMSATESLLQIRRDSSLDTTWTWYLEIASGQWTEFGSLSDLYLVETSIDASIIESHFEHLQGHPGRVIKVPFIISGGVCYQREYSLILEGTNSQGSVETTATDGRGSCRRVRRRPKLALEPGVLEQHICERHPIKPCKSSTCPMYNYVAGDVLWIWRGGTDRRWRHFSVLIGTQLERRFSNPDVDEFSVYVGDELTLNVIVDTRCNFTVKSITSSGECDSAVRENREGGTKYEVKRLFYCHEGTTAAQFSWYWLHVPPPSTNSAESEISAESHELCQQLLQLWNNTDTDQWVEYGNPGAIGAKSSISGAELESFYQRHPNGAIAFTTNFERERRTYLINLDNMTQTNQTSGTIRNIKRRFKLQRSDETDDRFSGIEVPKIWGNSFESDYVILTGTDPDFKILKQYVGDNLSRQRVGTITRLQSGQSWKIYNTKKGGLEKRVKLGQRNSVNEIVLFFPCEQPLSHNQLDEIIENNLGDCDFYIMEERLNYEYGLGTYFAGDISTALKFCDASGRQQRDVIVALACLGRFAKGSSRSNVDSSVDTFVDNENDPNIFVIPDSALIYPAYKISFR